MIRTDKASHLIFLLLLLVGCASSVDKKKADKAEIFFNYGTSNLIHKEYTAALDNLLRALELSPNESRIHNNLGMAYYLKGQQDLARQHIQKAIELDSENTDAYINLASLEFAQGNYPAARSLYQKVLADLTYAQQYRTYYNLGLLALKENNPASAREYFEKSISENQEYCPAQFQIGELDLSAKKYQKALRHFRKARMGRCYKDPVPHYKEALALIYMGKRNEAILKLQDLMDQHPESRLSIKAQTIINDLEKMLPAEDVTRQKRKNLTPHLFEEKSI